MDTMPLDTRALQLPLDFSDGAGPASPYRPSPAPSALRRLVADVLSAEPAAVAVRREAIPVRSTATSPAVYRRRRLLAAVTLGLLASALSLLGGELVARVTGTPGSAVVEAAGEPVVYVVQPGDTLWSIAERITPDDRDIRHTVDRLAASTGGAMLQPGQRVVLPSS